LRVRACDVCTSHVDCKVGAARFIVVPDVDSDLRACSSSGCRSSGRSGSWRIGDGYTRGFCNIQMAKAWLHELHGNGHGAKRIITRMATLK
jgi:hypothetical protein